MLALKWFFREAVARPEPSARLPCWARAGAAAGALAAAAPLPAHTPFTTALFPLCCKSINSLNMWEVGGQAAPESY